MFRQRHGDAQLEQRWHPYQLNPGASQEGVNKMQMYQEKFGVSKTAQMVPQMTQVGLEV